jgi:uncharacterized membrane protein YidH (DUF202 family)
MAAVREPPAGSGAAQERTLLSWNRSGLAVLVCIAVLLRHLWPLEGASQIVALIVIAVASIVWGLALLAFTRAGAERDENVQLTRNVFRLMTVGTVMLAFVGFVLSIVAVP